MDLRYNARLDHFSSHQKTLINTVTCQGIGVHAGQPVRLKIMPAPANYGIWFKRTDSQVKNVIPALWSAVTATDCCTKISNTDEISVSTIEHLMAAFAAHEVDNALIEVDGPELPIMDGSAEPFILLIANAGIQEQSAPRRVIRILKEIMVEGNNNQRVSLKPSPKFALDFTIDFPGRIGMQAQQLLFSGSMTRFRNEICRARTYGFLEDVEKLHAAGLAKGGSLDNAVVINQGQVMNPEGLRYPDEFVRHKILDAIGDLYLAGAPIKGFYQAHNGGHTLNNKLLHALLKDSEAWEWENNNTDKKPHLWQPNSAEHYALRVSFG